MSGIEGKWASTKPRRGPTSLALLTLVMLLSVAGVVSPAPGAAPALSAYGHLPLSFVANLGQTDPRAAFVAHGRGYTLFVAPTETVFVAQPTAPTGQALASRLRALRGPTPGGDQASESARGAVVHMKLLGADASAVMTGEEQTSSVNYLIGNDRSKWRTNVPAYARVRSHGIYPGVDLIFYGNGRQFEYDFVVAPGTDPSSIRMRFDGVVARERGPALEIDPDGDLILRTATGDLRLRKPIAYQENHGARQPVAARYVLRTASAQTAEAQPEVGIGVAAYDPSRPLVIDPVLDYSTYLGGSGNDAGMAIAVDATGHAYVAGYTESPDFPTATGQAPAGGSRKAFVAKLNPAGSALLYATYLGGNGSSTATGIAVDAAGKAHVTGLTDSTDLFTTPNAHQPTNHGGTDAFVMKLNASGSTIDYSTYLGGGGADAGLGIALGGAGRIYLTGYTESELSDFTPPPTPTLLGPGGGADVFVAKLNPGASASTSLNYLTLLGGTGRDEGHAIAVDGQGQAHITGFTDSDTYPTQGSYQQNQPGTDVFVTKLNAAGNALLYSTYLGGAGTDVGLGIALDTAGKIFVTGHTDSPNFPMSPSPYQGTPQGGVDAFVTKLDPDVPGSISLLYSTYLGGSASDAGLGIAVGPGPNSHVYVAGYTDSTNFPTLNGPQTNQGGRDAFVVRLQPGVAAPLVYSTYVGGGASDEAYGIALDAEGNAYVTGLTQSGDFPSVSAFATTLGGSQDAFVAKLTARPDLTVTSLSVTASGTTVTVTDTTKNEGEIAVGATTTTFYRSTDPNLDASDVVLGSRAVPALEAGASDSASTQLTSPAGAYFIIAKADANGAILEVNENNNTKTTTGTIGVGPDLTVESLDVPGSVGTSPAGTPITVNDSTRNASSVPAGASTTRLYLVTGTTLVGGEVPCASASTPPCFLGSRAVPALLPSAQSTGQTTFPLPNMAGTFRILAKADADNAVAEANEGNNVSTASAAFTIGPDLRATLDVPAASSFPAAGATISVAVFTRNDPATPAPAPPSTTTLYLSASSTFDASAVLLAGSAVAVPQLTPGEQHSGSPTFALPVGHTGIRYIFAKADDGNVVAESNEGNNISAGTAINIGADLIVLSLDVPGAVANLPAGATFTVNDFTRSDNSAPAGASTTRFYLVTETPLVGGEVPCASAATPPCVLGSRAVPALPPSTTNTGPTTLTLPTNMAGTFRIIAKADADNAVAEFNESNNFSAASLPFTMGPDLVVSLDLPGQFAAVAAGATISITDRTKNDGGTSIGASTTKFFLSSDANPTAFVPLCAPGSPSPTCAGQPPPTRSIPPLGAGVESLGSTQFTLPTQFAGTALAGQYRVTAVADANSVQAESNEANNVAVSSPIAIGPDLTISGSTVPATALAGATIFVSDFTKNRGAGNAPASITGIYLSNDAVLDAGDVSLGSRAIPSLVAGAHDSESTAVVIPSATPAGCYFIIVTADAGHAVGESDEANNALAQRIGILPAQGATTPCAPPQPDFNGDGKADILWRNASGLVGIWLMDGLSISSTGTPASATADWTIQGVGDFNGDGQADILWRNASGLVGIWLMDGLSISSTGTPASATADWTIQGVGDFNGDGQADILWRNASGLVGIWLMDGLSISSTGTPASAGADWTIQGVGDFNGDGKADILWRNASGLVGIWLMDGLSISSTGTPASATADWTIQGVGDFNGDGQADILWRNASGLVGIWLMDGLSISSTGTPASATADWTIQGVGDFNGDGQADILWRNASGLVGIWLMDGLSIGSTGTPASVPADWAIL